MKDMVVLFGLLCLIIFAMTFAQDDYRMTREQERQEYRQRYNKSAPSRRPLLVEPNDHPTPQESPTPEIEPTPYL